MVRALMLVALVTLIGCRSKKELTVEYAHQIDSVAASDHQLRVSSIDSAFSFFTFTFDSLEIYLERPCSIAQIPAEIRVKASRGCITNQRREFSDHIECYNLLDSVAFKASAASNATEVSTSASVYDPRSLSWAAIAAIVVAAIALALIIRKHLS